ncbi:unnamed protein product [Bemisia tabaci]|uniref:Uncharacterized protein n=1 Tax=Bemisia tabaci TaxID=7038 RepID=A0A9P0AEL8_BEMTA|nr:unnamed protein product [Bemisia tabaci]
MVPHMKIKLSGSLVSSKRVIKGPDYLRSIVHYVEYEKADDKNKEGMQMKKFKTKNEGIFASTDLDEYYEKFRVKINKESFDFHMNRSGWVLKKIHTGYGAKCQPLLRFTSKRNVR